MGGDAGDAARLRLSPADRREPAAVLEAWLRERAREAIDRAVARHAGALRVAPSRIGLRDPATRWGSASRSGGLSFSWRLVLAPPEALETVVVHELAHLRVFGHGPRFWALVASRRPDHVDWRRWLRLHSHELHGALDATAEEGTVRSPDAGGPGQNRTATAEGEGFTDPWAHHLPNRPTPVTRSRPRAHGRGQWTERCPILPVSPGSVAARLGRCPCSSSC